MDKIWKIYKVRAKKDIHFSEGNININIRKNHKYMCELYFDNTVKIIGKEFEIKLKSEVYDEIFKPILE